MTRTRTASRRDRRELRKQLAKELRRPADQPITAAARDLLRLKLELAERTGEVRACSTCAKGREDEFDGGACCGGVTWDVFGDEEIAALAITGTRGRRLRLGSAGAGCAFRGSKGCTLALADRPAICVHYSCRSLAAEISARGDAAEIVGAQDRLANAMRRFHELEQARCEGELFDESFAGAVGA